MSHDDPAQDSSANDLTTSDLKASDLKAENSSRGISQGDIRDAEAVDVAALADFSRGADGLLPAIAQDADNGRVLMMAWMNEEALRETMATGRAVYYSRSRGQLWRKGETSGHQQVVREIRVDCDRDTLLLRVTQTGAACHEGYESCFFRRVDREGVTLEVADERLVDPKQVYG